MILRTGAFLRRLPTSTLHFFALGMALSVAFVIGNTVGTGLVLGEGGAERLPVLYIIFPVLSVPAAFALSTLIDRGGQIRLFQFELGSCGAALLLLWALLEAGLGIARDGIYLVAKVHEVLADILFWTVVMQYATNLELKRFATALGVGFALGGVIGGGCAAVLVELLSPSSLLVVCVGLYALVALHLQVIGGVLRPLGGSGDEEEDEGGTGLVSSLATLPGIFRRHPMALWVCLGVLLMIVTYCFAEYLFYSVYAAEFPDEAELTGFLALMNGVLQAAEMAFLLLVATPLLARGGPVLRNLALPVVSTGSLAVLLADFRLPAAIAMQVVGEAFSNAVFEPVKSVNFAAVPHRFAGRVRLLCDGAVFPIGMAGAGSALLLLQETGAPILAIGFAGLALSLLFVLAGWRTGRLYLPELVRNLAAGTIDFGRVGSETGTPAERGLQAAALLAAPDREARLFGLRLAARLGETVALAKIEGALEGGDMEVREAGVAALLAQPSERRRRYVAGALGSGRSGADDLETVALGVFLADPNVADDALRRDLATHASGAMRLAARLVAPCGPNIGPHEVAALDPIMRSRLLEALSAAAGATTGTAGLAAATPMVLALTLAEDPATRARALAVLTRLAGPGDTDAAAAAVCALADEVAQVRMAALGFLATLGDAAPVDRIVDAMADGTPAVRNAAARVLAGLGAPGEAAARRMLAAERTAVVEAAVYALSRMTTRSAREALLAALEPSYARIACNRPLARRLAGLSPSPAAEALTIAVSDSDLTALHRVLQVLEALSQDRTVHQLRRALDSDDRRGRADAVEALASLPDRRFVQPLMPLLEELAGARRDEGEGRSGDHASLAVAARIAADDPEPWLRRAGLWALATLGVAAPTNEEEIRLMDRLLFLKSVRLFREIPFDDLLALDAAMELVEYPAGETVIAHGSVGSSLYVVAEGELVVLRAGRELARLPKGDCFGEMALIDAAPRAADVVAAADCRLLRMTRTAFDSLIDEHPRVLLELCRLFVRRLRDGEASAGAAGPPGEE